jgi:hypothetical protein
MLYIRQTKHEVHCQHIYIYIYLLLHPQLNREMFYPYGTLRCEQKQTVYVSVCSKFSDCNLEKINEKKCPQSIIIVHGILDHHIVGYTGMIIDCCFT